MKLKYNRLSFNHGKTTDCHVILNARFETYINRILFII